MLKVAKLLIDKVNALAVSSDSTFFASGSDDCSVKIVKIPSAAAGGTPEVVPFDKLHLSKKFDMDCL